MGDGYQPGEVVGTSLTPPPLFDAQGHPIPSAIEWHKAHAEELNRALDDLALITDETDTDEVWDEVFRNLGVDTATGGPLES